MEKKNTENNKFNLTNNQQYSQYNHYFFMLVLRKQLEKMGKLQHKKLGKNLEKKSISTIYRNKKKYFKLSFLWDGY